jgi:hypothetical protein
MVAPTPGGFPGARFSRGSDMLINSLPDYGITGTIGSKAVLQESPDLHAPNFQGVGGAASGYFAVDGVVFGQRATNYHQILDPTGLMAALQLGNLTDPTNYYNNGTHTWRTRALGTIATLSLAAGMALPGVKANSPTIGVGYATGAGGTVAQGTNRTTGVTLNTVCGAITLFSQVNTAVSAATAQSFTVTNSAVAATDVIVPSQKSGTDKYEIFITNVAAGSFQITTYTTGGTTNEAPVFNFLVLKAVTS